MTWDIPLLAIAVSMDAFAVAICTGIRINKRLLLGMLVVGLYFGVFQALMPLIGFWGAFFWADNIKQYDHWIAFALLALIGVKMIIESFHKPRCKDRLCGDQICEDRECPKIVRVGIALTPAVLIPMAVATSIDALAVGVSFAFMGDIDVWLAIPLIGLTTFAFSFLGVFLGNRFNSRFKNKAELVGGVILVLIGVRILVEHLGILTALLKVG